MVERQEPDTRRADIARAVGRLLAEEPGALPGMRQIATEAGVTTGALQHHFRNKDEMLLFTLEHHGQRWAARLRHRAALNPDHASPRRVLAAIVRELLPLDAERTAETCVAATFVLRAATRPELARHYRAHRRFLHELIQEQCARAGVGEPAAAATLLLHAVEGMRSDCLLLGPDSVDVAQLLARILPQADDETSAAH